MRKTTLLSLSLDASTTTTGFAVFENGELISFEKIDLKISKLDADTRLHYMKTRILKTMDIYKPDIVVCEESSANNNIRVQRMLSELNGLIEGFALFTAADYIIYSPNVWRSLVGDRDKEIPSKRDDLKHWSVCRVKELYNLDITSDDIADAILIGQARINEIDRAVKENEQGRNNSNS